MSNFVKGKDLISEKLHLLKIDRDKAQREVESAQSIFNNKKDQLKEIEDSMAELQKDYDKLTKP